VTQREREIALRMALGTRRGGVIRGIIGLGRRLAVPGPALGVVGVLLSGRVLRSFLYEGGTGRPRHPAAGVHVVHRW
jgi:ABC-type antimicrobial peptide transport system permease subunit